MRKKNEEYRKKIRKEQLQEYFKQARLQLLEKEAFDIDQSQKMVEEVNREVNHCIQASSIHEIYFNYCSKTSKGNLRMLSEQNTLMFLQVLDQNLQAYECLLLMKQLAAAQFKCIFMNSRCQGKGIQTISSLFAIANKHMQEISVANDAERLVHIKSVVTLCLDCILALIIQSRLVGQGFYVESQVYKIINQSRFWVSLSIFSQNPLFLVILYLADIQQDFSTTKQFIQFIEGHPIIVTRLINQIEPQRKSLSLPSLQMVNTILKSTNISQIQILPQLFEKTIYIYKELQSIRENGAPSFFRPQNFEDMMDTLVIIFSKAYERVLQDTLSDIMIRTGFWSFIFCIINIETRFIKQKCYQLIELALINTGINSKTICKQLQKDIFGAILQGLSGPQTGMVCLKISLIMIDHPANSIHSLHELSEYINNPQFRSLLKSPYREISELASNVYHKLDQRIQELTQHPL